MNQPNNDELEPRLKEVLDIVRPVPPRDPQAAAHGRAQFLAQAKEIGQPVSKSEKRRHIGWFGSIQNYFFKKEYKPMFTTLVSLITVLILGFGGSVATAYAAQDDLPGDALYTVKVFTEDTRLVLANDAQDIALYEEFAERRVQETVQLADSSRFDDVETAMLRYETQLKAMNQTLARLAAHDPVQADALAARIQTMLEAQIQILTQLRQRVADPARSPIDDVLSRSRQHAGIEFAGLVEAIQPDAWVIAARTVGVTAQTEIKGDIMVGNLVKVHAYLSADDTLTAREIELVAADTNLDINGLVESISDTTWTINGQTVLVSAATDIRGDIQVGDWVVAKVLLAADGSLTALVIHLPDSEDVPGNGNDDNGNGSDDNGNGNDDNGNGSDDNGNDDNGNGSDDNGNDDNGNGSDDNGNDDNGNGSDENGNDDNGNGSDDNGNDDNGNGSDENGNDDNGNGSDDNGNGSDDNGNDDNGNGSDDNGNDDNGNGSDDNGNDDNGNGSDENGNDDNGNGSDENGNDGNGNGSDDNGNGSDDNGNDDNGNGSNDNGNDSTDDNANDNGSTDDNGNDNSGTDDNSNDNGGTDDNTNDNGGTDDNGNDNGGADDNSNDNDNVNG